MFSSFVKWQTIDDTIYSFPEIVTFLVFFLQIFLSNIDVAWWRGKYILGRRQWAPLIETLVVLKTLLG